MRRPLLMLSLLLAGALPAGGQPPAAPAATPAPAKGMSIQSALDAKPGQLIYLPPGDYTISTKIVINKHGSGLFGPGRIIQTDPAQPIIEVRDANNVQLRDITLTRAEGKMEATASAIDARATHNLRIDNVQIYDNRAQNATMSIVECPAVQIRHCLIQNYARIGIDDRTQGKDYGFAFNCIDGTGMIVRESNGALIQGNRIVENNMVATKAVQDKYELGKFVKKNPEKGVIVSQELWDSNYFKGWHQGSALQVTAPENTDCIQIIGNSIENAAQGIDIHADHVVISNNIVNNAFIGMKAMHGSRNVVIIGNQFVKNDLWAIGLMPGAASHAAGVPAHDHVKPEDAQANVDGGHIIANNVISDFGYGNANWLWGNDGCPLRFNAGQKPINPALKDVIVEGNMVYDPGRDGLLIDGKPQVVAPRYKYAVLVEGDTGDQGAIKGPLQLHFANNVLHPGHQGVSNVELKP